MEKIKEVISMQEGIQIQHMFIKVGETTYNLSKEVMFLQEGSLLTLETRKGGYLLEVIFLIY